MNYNLLDKEWIPVFYRDGIVKRVGIRKALEDAHMIRQIAASNPMDRVAILRFLLALLYWCKGNPPDGADSFSGNSFPPDWFKKLDGNGNKDCFNLLGGGKRFYQEDCKASRCRAVTDLIQEIPTGNNFWHFRHSTDKKDGLCPACCAIGLLRLPLFSVSGLPDLMAGINGAPPIYVVPWGKSLRETLLTNWSSYPTLGEPSWVNPNGPTPDKEVPLLTGLTLLSRRVRLHDPDGQAGVCIDCGLHETALIRTIEFQTAGYQENDEWNDPHVVYTYTEETKRKALRAEDLTRAGKFRMDRPWPSLLARMVETDRQASLLIVGFATKQAKNIDVWERTIEMPSTGSIQETVAERIKKWQEEGQSLGKKASRSREHVENSLVASIRPHVEGKVSVRAGELIAGGEEAWEQAANEYSPMMAAIAKSLSPGFTTSAVQRRKQIAAVKPNMRPNTEVARKPGRKKGGDK